MCSYTPFTPNLALRRRVSVTACGKQVILLEVFSWLQTWRRKRISELKLICGFITVSSWFLYCAGVTRFRMTWTNGRTNGQYLQFAFLSFDHQMRVYIGVSVGRLLVVSSCLTYSLKKQMPCERLLRSWLVFLIMPTSVSVHSAMFDVKKSLVPFVVSSSKQVFDPYVLCTSFSPHPPT